MNRTILSLLVATGMALTPACTMDEGKPDADDTKLGPNGKAEGWGSRDNPNIFANDLIKTLDELREALELNLDRIMLDNMSLEEMREAVRLTRGRVPLEASGNVNLDNVSAVAATGVNYISIGMLTHSVQALDISLLLDTDSLGGKQDVS